MRLVDMVKYRLNTGGNAMTIDTTITKNIRVADEKASYDAACKRMLSDRYVVDSRITSKGEGIFLWKESNV